MLTDIRMPPPLTKYEAAKTIADGYLELFRRIYGENIPATVLAIYRGIVSPPAELPAMAHQIDILPSVGTKIPNLKHSPSGYLLAGESLDVDPEIYPADL